MDRLLCVLFQLMVVGRIGPIALCLVSVDGGWSDWADWSPCSATCGTGSLQSFRTCDNPVKVGNGLDCVGETTRVQDCHAFPCDGTFFPVSVYHSCFIYLYL